MQDDEIITTRRYRGLDAKIMLNGVELNPIASQPIDRSLVAAQAEWFLKKHCKNHVDFENFVEFLKRIGML